jgi:peroxiredoxin
MLEPGATAPDFQLRGVDGGDLGTHSLSAYTDAGRAVLLVFYAFDFNPVCRQGMCSLRDTDWFAFTDDLQVLAVSGDGVFAHRAFADREGFTFPLLADTDRSVGEAYGVVADEAAGMRRVHRRSAFVVDADRTVRYATAVEADSPADIDISPVAEAVRDLPV